MSFRKILKREFEVAFSKEAQPIGFRIVKYLVLISLVYVLWGSQWLWIILGAIFGLGLVLHFWYRHKTKGWTESYGLWKHERERQMKL